MSVAAVILDTNVFVAAGFKRNSAAARILEQVRSGQLRMVWNEATRRETEYILKKIPPLSWDGVAELFRDEDCYGDATAAEAFDHISDRDDRKYAALAAAAGVVLLTNDDHLLRSRDLSRIEILTPAEYWRQYESDSTTLL